MHTRRPTLRVATGSSDPLVTLPQVLLARTERLQADFNAQLRRREVTKEYVALVLLDPPAQPLQPPPPLPPGRQACAASPPAPPAPPAPPTPLAPPAPPTALREGSMLVHWMEKRPRAPMRLSATSIEGWARCESEVLHVRCMRARRREVTKEYVALVLLDPPAQPLQPPPPLPPGGQACAASPPAPPTPPAPPAALREGSMLVHWMEKRPRAPMRLSATSIEGACLRSGASPGAGLPPHLATPHQASSIAALPPARRHSARYARLCRLGAVRERGASRAVHAGTAARSLQRRRR